MCSSYYQTEVVFVIPQSYNMADILGSKAGTLASHITALGANLFIIIMNEP